MTLRMAQKRQMLRTAMVVAAYLTIFLATFEYVRHHHPQGVMLYFCAALPWLALCGTIASVGVYLYEERDGYSRELAMRCLLWGAAGTMATSFFLGFLRMFGWRGQPPLFVEFYAFGAAVAVAKISYSISNRPECEPREKREL